MKKKMPHRKLTLSRETLHRMSEHDLAEVAGAAPTRGATCDCDSGPKSLCASCFCPI